MAARLSPTAEQDLIAVFLDGCREFGSTQAGRYVEKLRRAFDLLADFPFLAAERHEISPAVRVHPLGSHLLVYREEAGDVLILRILHARSD